MANNYNSLFQAGAGVISTAAKTRIIAVHAHSTVAGSFDIKGATSGVLKFFVAANESADIYIGDMGVPMVGSVSGSVPADGAALTLIVG